MNELANLTARLERIEGLLDQALPACADAVEREVQRTVASGASSAGQAWKPKLDGSKPLVRAAQAVTVVARGQQILIAVKGPEALHHLGRARGGIARPIIPVDRLPTAMSTAIQHVLAEHFDRAVK
jgi:hypothetical protein